MTISKETMAWAEGVMTEWSTLLAEMAAGKLKSAEFVKLVNDVAIRAVRAKP